MTGTYVKCRVVVEGEDEGEALMQLPWHRRLFTLAANLKATTAIYDMKGLYSPCPHYIYHGTLQDQATSAAM